MEAADAMRHVTFCIVLFAILLAVTGIPRGARASTEPSARRVAAGRPRVGASLVGGAVLGRTEGPASGFDLRIGVRPLPWLGLAYRNAPYVLAPSADDGTDFGFMDHNTLLASVIPTESLELGVGPSIDYVDLRSGDGLGTTSTRGVALALHAKLGLTLGEVTSPDGRRRAVTLCVDVHPLLSRPGPSVMVTGGIGFDFD